ncbi:antA/AntB antirepressor family protein [Pseudomonas sp.]|jgi:anti-repressor protein|uniref:antA/AntB antirepressor family protein n=1 Tax=Pseudomonas sp. TaxID=306 RepID=UPI0037C6E5B3
MTQQLIPVFNGALDGRNQQMCDAKDLHDFLGVQTRFNDWIARRIDQYGFVEGEDFYSVMSKRDDQESGLCYSDLSNKADVCSPEPGSKTERRGGHNRTDYHLTLDTAKELAMVENNEQGRQVRRYFIAMEREARESRGVAYLSVTQQLAIHRQVPKLLSQLKAETSPAIRATLHAQLVQHCHLLALPVPAIDSVGRAAQATGDLFPVTQG